jgi:hypothetical protein
MMNTTNTPLAMNRMIPETWDNEDSWESIADETKVVKTKVVKTKQVQEKQIKETTQERKQRLKTEKEERMQAKKASKAATDAASKMKMEMEKQQRDEAQARRQAGFRAMKAKKTINPASEKEEVEIDLPEEDPEDFAEEVEIITPPVLVETTVESNHQLPVHTCQPPNRRQRREIAKVLAGKTPSEMKKETAQIKPEEVVKEIEEESDDSDDSDDEVTIILYKPTNKVLDISKPTPQPKTPEPRRTPRKSRWGAPISPKQDPIYPPAPIKVKDDGWGTPVDVTETKPRQSRWGPPKEIMKPTPPTLINAWEQKPKIVVQPNPDVILTMARAEMVRTKVMTHTSEPASDRIPKEEWDQIRSEGFEMLNDPTKRSKLLHKTNYCRNGKDCWRASKGQCDFYHSEEERKIPMCPFKQTCRSNKCNHCHPGQETEWVKNHPLPQGCPKTKQTTTTTKQAPKTIKRTPPPKQLGPVHIEAELFKTNPDAANLAMKAAMVTGREVVITQ